MKYSFGGWSLYVKVMEYYNHIEVDLKGSLVAHTISDLTIPLRRMLHDRAVKGRQTKAFVFNFEKVDVIDSSGVSTLLNIHKHYGHVCLYGMSDFVNTSLDILGLENVFIMYKDKKEFRANRSILRTL